MDDKDKCFSRAFFSSSIKDEFSSHQEEWRASIVAKLLLAPKFVQNRQEEGGERKKSSRERKECGVEMKEDGHFQ